MAFALNPEEPNPDVKTWAALATIVVFFLLQAWGAKEQSWAMMIMTYGAILGLVLFWIAGAVHFSPRLIWPDPVLMAKAMRKAVEAGREAFLAGRMPKKLYSATPSSPTEGKIAPKAA